MRIRINDVFLLITLLVFMVGGICVLFAILRAYVKNFEKPLALPLFVAGIAAYMAATILLGYYLPRWLPLS